MGIRPSLHLVVAITNLETTTENYITHIIDNRWTLGDDWQGYKVFGPNEERLKVMRDAAFKRDDPNNVAFREFQYLDAARQHTTTNIGKEAVELIIWDSDYYPSVMTLPISSLPYDHDCLWALASIHQEYHSQNQFVEIPRIPPNHDCSEYAAWWKGAQEGREIPYPLIVEAYQQKLDCDHNYATFSYYGAPTMISYGLWFFKEILKMDIDRKDIRLGIYWKWS